jgi:hypothetical protein
MQVPGGGPRPPIIGGPRPMMPGGIRPPGPGGPMIRPRMGPPGFVPPRPQLATFAVSPQPILEPISQPSP